MKKLTDMTAKRLFSLNLYKNRKLMLGEMSFGKDFVNEKRGDIYPIIEKGGSCTETVCSGKYAVASEKAYLKRLIGRHFPFATYEMAFSSLCGEAGLFFESPSGKANILCVCDKDGRISFKKTENGEDEIKETDIPFSSGDLLIVSCRDGAFDVYYKKDGYPKFVCTFSSEGFSDIAYENIYRSAKACVCIKGKAELTSVQFYIDCGVSQADIRPVRYENGEIMMENGRVFLTFTIRMQAEKFQGVFAWIPGTAELELTGAVFYATGDGLIGKDVAASLMYDRNVSAWRLWVCSFDHGHILGHAQFEGDIRYGVNIVDITLMETKEGSLDTEFYGKFGDEDPDFIYDEKNEKWYMSICRPVSDENGTNYRYFFFESDKAFDGYKHIGNTKCGADTGGSILHLDGKYYFVCGSCFDKRADYRIYDIFDPESYTSEKFDYDDGGFRGWGSIIPVKKGTRTVYYHITFDRANASDYNWSYGNMYCFELE